MTLTACFMLVINDYILIQTPGIESKLWISVSCGRNRIPEMSAWASACLRKC